MFEEEEWLALVQRLIELTRADKLAWTRTHGVVSVAVDGTEYIVGSLDNDDRPPYFLRLWDLGGEGEIARLDSEPVDEGDVWGEVNGPQNAAQWLPTLRSLAHRSASGGTARLKKLLAGLDALG